MHAIDVFVVVSGTFSIIATVPLMYLAFRSSREAQELHLLQVEVAQLMGEVREIQDEIHHDQRRATHELARTQETVEKVARAATRRRRLPRVRVELARPAPEDI